MEKNLDQIIEDARTHAARITETSGHVRKSFAEGRTNSAQRSTVEGVAKAMKVIVDNHTPRGYTRL
jgi:hypothetical protein